MAGLTDDPERSADCSRAGLKQLEAEYNMFFSRPAAASAVGDAQPRRGAGQEMGSRLHPVGAPIASSSTRCSGASRPSSTCGTAACARARKDVRARSRCRRRKASREAEAGRTQRSCTSPSFQDPMREMDKLHTLYDSLMDARREAGRRRRAVPPLRGAGKIRSTKCSRRARPKWRFAWR